MPTTRIAFVDVYPIRFINDILEFLLLRRAPGAVRPGTWEAVHGHIDAGENPVDTARRELKEEVGCAPRALYNLSRVDQFYLHATHEVVLIPVFAAVLPGDAVIQLSGEHAAMMWLQLSEAQARCTWPRAARAMEDVVKLLGKGDAGAAEAQLRVD